MWGLSVCLGKTRIFPNILHMFHHFLHKASFSLNFSIVSSPRGLMKKKMWGLSEHGDDQIGYTCLDRKRLKMSTGDIYCFWEWNQHKDPQATLTYWNINSRTTEFIKVNLRLRWSQFARKNISKPSVFFPNNGGHFFASPLPWRNWRFDRSRWSQWVGCPSPYGRCRNYRTEVEEYEGTVIYRTLLFYNSVFLGRCEKKTYLNLLLTFFVVL